MEALSSCVRLLLFALSFMQTPCRNLFVVVGHLLVPLMGAKGGVSDAVCVQCTRGAYAGVVAWTVSANFEATCVRAYAFAQNCT